MSISDTLFLAILSMDAYNRGYSPGVIIGQSVQIGDAVLQQDSQILGKAPDGSYLDQDYSFFAQAYDWNGKTVISYRGTDNTDLLDNASDIYTGWLAGAGLPAQQPTLAEEFYTDVTGESVLLLTGHSLGGGLAGYIAAITHDTAYIFDNMPYAALAAIRVIDILGVPSAASITSLHVSGEILTVVRGLAPEIDLAVLSQPIADVAAAAEVALPLEQSNLPTLDAYNGSLLADPFGVDRHSMPLLVILQYASDNGLIDWAQIGPALFSSFFNHDIGTALGLIKGVTGASEPESQMLTEIAYSALYSSSSTAQYYSYVFGDTAIRALFRDADLLGQRVAAPDSPSFLLDSDIQKALTDIIVEYAGLLAWISTERESADIESR